MYKIICIGKIREDYLIAGIKEYIKRMEAFQKVEIVEVKESVTLDIGKNIELEGKQILEKISKDEWVVTLEIEGKMIDSLTLATTLEQWTTYGKSKITFIIGGSNGLSQAVKERSDMALSFSKFTFPHQLMRLIFMEQLYRAMTINHHKEYHK